MLAAVPAVRARQLSAVQAITASQDELGAVAAVCGPGLLASEALAPVVAPVFEASPGSQ